MISLDSGDKIRGDASAADVVDYILSGTDANAIKQLADGQLPVAIGDLYTADSVDAVTSIILVNTDSVARTVNLYLLPSGGSARRLIPKNMTLGIGHSLYTDGRTITVLDASGQVLSTWAVDDTPVDGETDKPISSNWAFDHVAAADPHTGYLLESLLDAHSMVMAVSDNTPVVLAVAASRFVGRKSSGNIAAMTGAEALALLTGANLDVGAYDVRGVTLTADGLTSGRVVYAGASGVLSGVAAFTFSVDTLTVTKMAAHISGAIAYANGIAIKSSVAGGNSFIEIHGDDTSLGGRIDLGGRTRAGFEGAIDFATPNTAVNTLVRRLIISGGADTAVWLFQASTIAGIVLGGVLTLNGQAFDAGSGSLLVATTGFNVGVKVTSTQDAGGSASFIGYVNDASPSVGSILCDLVAKGEDDGAGTELQYGALRFMIEDPAAGVHAGKMDVILWLSGSLNVALTLSAAGGLGVDADIGTADDPVALFDDYDDALALRQSIQQHNHDLLVKMGVFTKKDTGSGYMMNIQPMTRLLAGGIYQNRAKIDDLEERLARIGG